MVKTITTLFSGAGGVDKGAIAAGFEHCQAIEYDPQIAEIFKANIGDCFVQNILDADPFKFERPDILHASPVCKQFSTANPKKGEAQLDIDCAKKVADFISVLQPQYFTLENVEAYRKSKSFNLIVETLNKLGYWSNWQVLNHQILECWEIQDTEVFGNDPENLIEALKDLHYRAIAS